MNLCPFICRSLHDNNVNWQSSAYFREREPRWLIFIFPLKTEHWHYIFSLGMFGNQFSIFTSHDVTKPKNRNHSMNIECSQSKNTRRSSGKCLGNTAFQVQCASFISYISSINSLFIRNSTKPQLLSRESICSENRINVVSSVKLGRTQ